VTWIEFAIARAAVMIEDEGYEPPEWMLEAVGQYLADEKSHCGPTRNGSPKRKRAEEPSSSC